MILVPLDGSPLAEEALDIATAVAKQIVLLHVVTPGMAFATSFVAAERKRAAEHLQRLAVTLRKRGIEVDTLVRTGEPSKVIASEARRTKVALIVMSSHGRTGAREFSFGSVAERVMRRSRVPVLMLRGRRRRPVKRILVALDGSGREVAALPLVRSIAVTTGAEVVLLHVTTTNAPPKEAVRTDRFLVRRGEPAETILCVAREETVDVITITVAGGAHFGRVAERVLKETDRPVLVVRAC